MPDLPSSRTSVYDSRMIDEAPGIRILSLVALLLDRRVPVPLAWIQERMDGAYGPPESDAGDEPSRKAFVAGRRKFLRDQDILGSLGLRIRHLKGGDGDDEGYILDSDAFRAPELYLDATQAESVRLAAALVRGIEGFPLGSDLSMAIAKLSALTSGLDLSTADGHVAAAWSCGHRLAVRAPNLKQTLATLAEAVIERRQIRVTYRSLGSGNDVSRLLDPWSLVLRRGVWHLVGWCHLRNDVRLFDAHRMQQVRADGPAAAFERPADFDNSAWTRREPWEFAKHPAVCVTLSLDRTVAGISGTRLAGARTVAQLPDGGLTIEVTATDLQPLLGLVLSLWGRARILGPPEAVDRFAELVDRVAAAHSDPPEPEEAA